MSENAITETATSVTDAADAVTTAAGATSTVVRDAANSAGDASQAIADNIADNIPGIESYIIKVAEQIQSAVINVAPEAWDIALGVVRVEGLVLLAPAIGSALIGYIFWRFSCRFFSNQSPITNHEAFKNLPKGFNFVLGSISGLVSLVSMIITINTVLNVWAWVSLFLPEIALAKKAIDAVL